MIALPMGLSCAQRSVHLPPKEVRRASEELVGRVAASRQAVKEAGAIWPGFEALEAPEILVYDAKGEWLFRDEGDGLAGFVKTGQLLDARPVFYTEPSISFADEVIPYPPSGDFPIGQIVYRKRPNAIWSKQLTPMFVVESVEALRARKYELTTEGWMAVLVHELFHLHQRTSDARKAVLRSDAFERGDRDQLETFAKKNNVYRQHLDSEVIPLEQGLLEPPGAARQILKNWLEMRGQRIGKTKMAFAKETGCKANLDSLDGFFVFSEGTARYVEERWFLEVEHKGLLAADPLSSSRGTSGEDDLGTYSRTNYVYHLGMLVSRLLDRARPNWKRTVFDNERLLVGEVEAL